MAKVVLFDPERLAQAERPLSRRKRINKIFLGICIATASISVLTLVLLLLAIGIQGGKHLNWQFLTSPPSPNPQKAGIHPALFGTVWLCMLCAACTLPLGVAAAIFLEEFKPRGWLSRRIHGFIQLNIANLAGVPSVVYGIIGLSAFVQMFDVFGSNTEPVFEIGARYFDQHLTEGDRVVLIPVEGPTAPPVPITPQTRAVTASLKPIELNIIGPGDPLPQDPQLRSRTIRSNAEGGRISHRSWYYIRVPLGRGVLTGALTLMLVILPILIIAAQEAIRAVPDSLREGALGLGATPWQVVWKVTLPAATPGILTGSIIAMSRAIGEAAPLLMIAGIVFISNAPGNLMDDFTALPLQIYNWAQRPQRPFHDLAASGIIVLLAVLLVFNGIAVYLRHKLHRPLS